jgi:hypothetical protein
VLRYNTQSRIHFKSILSCSVLSYKYFEREFLGSDNSAGIGTENEAIVAGIDAIGGEIG